MRAALSRIEKDGHVASRAAHDPHRAALSDFLNVSRSATGRRWRARLEDGRLAQAIAERHELPEILGRVLAARGVGLDEAEAFLNPTLRMLMPQPSALRDMEKGAERLAEAVIAGEKIGVIGDYDVDGICASAMLQLFLRAVGSDASVHLPDRLTEGYGPSQQAVSMLKEQGCDLLVTLDCGVAAHDPLAHAAELGFTTIIVDHHLAGEILPQAHAVINPNRQDDLSGFGYLCAAGVTMILIAAVNKILRGPAVVFETRGPSPTCCNGWSSWRWRRCATSCRSRASTAPMSRKGSR